MKITTLGIVLAAKNMGVWLATMSFTSIADEPSKFVWLFLIYALINVPSDLLLMNHASTRAENETTEEPSND